jgi:response regulator RpfG family c-di-GMP phosphodiesterase
MDLNELFIVAVDDEPMITTHLDRHLSKYCKKYVSFNRSQDAFEFINLHGSNIDIVISDIRMPYLNGIELSKSIKSINKKTIVILLSASNDVDYLMEAINTGVDKFIPKPYRISSLLEILEEYARNIVNARNAEKLKINEEIRIMQESIICTLGNVIENRSKETGNHVKRVSLYCQVLAEKLDFDEHHLNLLKLSSALHDIGKVAISDDILNKPSALTENEFEIVKKHTTVGYDILKESNNELLDMAAKVAYTHHENWDGTGYPCGLSGDEICIEGRILALCDVFDALAHNRCYKKAWEIGDIVVFIKEQRGKKFDPGLVDIFLDSLGDIIQIYKKHNEK